MISLQIIVIILFQLVVFSLPAISATDRKLDVRDYSSLAVAINANADKSVTLVVSNVQTINTNMIIPNSITLSVVPGGVISVANAKTITINGAFECGQFQCFTGKGLVKFGTSSPVELIPEWWGAIGDGITNDTNAIQAAFQATPSAGTVNFGSKQFKINSNVTCTKSISIKGNATIKGTGYISFEGVLEDTGQTLSKAAQSGTQNINVTSTKGIAAGDLIILQNRVNYSFAPFRPYYQDGEFVEVLHVTPSTITFKTKLQTSYTGIMTDKLYKVRPITVKIAPGIKFLSTGDFALRLSYCKDVTIDTIECIGGTSAAFSLNKSIHCQIIGGQFINKHTPPTGENYGMVIMNSQNITVSKATAHGTRHGTSTGGDAKNGSVPCRNIHFIDCSISNDLSTLQAADFHGNTVDSSYIRCKVAAPISLSGNNVSAIDCTAIANGANAPLQYTEVSGGTITFRGCNVSFADQSTANRAVAGTSSTELSKINRNYSIQVDNLTMNANKNSKAVGIIYHAAIGTVHSSFKYNNITILGTVQPDFRVLDCTIANPAKHAIAPIAPDTIYLANVNANQNSTYKYINKSGVFAGTRFTVPGE